MAIRGRREGSRVQDGFHASLDGRFSPSSAVQDARWAMRPGLQPAFAPRLTHGRQGEENQERRRARLSAQPPASLVVRAYMLNSRLHHRHLTGLRACNHQRRRARRRLLTHPAAPLACARHLRPRPPHTRAADLDATRNAPASFACGTTQRAARSSGLAGRRSRDRKPGHRHLYRVHNTLY